jgi:hypothetical protein
MRIRAGWQQVGHQVWRFGHCRRSERSPVTWEFMTGPSNTIKATFSGVLDDHTMTISGTWHLASDPLKDGKFKAKKEK